MARIKYFDSTSEEWKYADNANYYIHPTTSGNKHIPSGGSSGQILKWSEDGTATWSDESCSSTEYSRGTVSVSEVTDTIDIPITVTDTSSLSVYHNGLLLTPTTHYTATASAITLTYNAKAGDIFTFVGSTESGTSLNASADEVLFENSNYPNCTTVDDALNYLGNNSSYELPTASSTTLGGIKVGTNLNIDDGVLSATGTVTSVGSGVGLTGGPITGSGTLKTNLNDETSLGTLGSTSKLYAVGIDANGKLAVSVPWTDTTYTHPGSGTNPHDTTASDVGLGNVGNFKAVSTVASQGLTDTEKSNARNNIGAGTSNLTIGTTSTTAAAGDHTHSYIPTSQKGTNSGVAELDANGKVLSSQLPSYVDDVLEYSALSGFPATGETGKIYIDTTTNLSYRWSGSGYTEISPSIALGETSSTAYRGDRGAAAYTHSQATHARTDATKTEASSTNGNIKINGTETTVYAHPGSGTNPHSTTASDVGAMPVSGGTFTGTVVAQNNTSYTTKQIRNIFISTGDPTGGSNGDIWIKYNA